MLSASEDIDLLAACRANETKNHTSSSTAAASGAQAFPSCLAMLSTAGLSSFGCLAHKMTLLRRAA